MLPLDRYKLDFAIAPQELAEDADVSSAYFDFKRYHSATFIVCLAPAAANSIDLGDRLEIEVIEAKTMGGGDSQAIGALERALYANRQATAITVTFGGNGNAPQNGDTVTINGVTFTKAAATSVEDREFLNADGLEDCINSSAYGVHNALADNNAGTVTIVSTDPGNTKFTAVSSEDDRLKVQTLSAITTVSMTHYDLTLCDGYAYAGVKLTAKGEDLNVSAVLLRQGYKATQYSVADGILVP